MTLNESFLQTILANPADDTPRLVYADWLDEHGQADRAEFIRVQCELAHNGENDARRSELLARERELLEGREREWAGPVGELMEKYEFRRGFVERIELAGQDFLTHAEAIFALAPICHVEFDRKWDDAIGTLSRLAASSHLARLDTVSFDFGYSCLDDAILQVLASLPPLLQRLDSLSVFMCSITEVGLFSFFMSPHLERLSHLNFSICMIPGEQAGRALAESPKLRRLRLLRIDDTTLGDAAVRLLAPSENCRNLECLSLNSCEVGDSAAVALGQSPHLTRLNTLFLGGNSIGNEGTTALAASRHLAGLKNLALHKNRIGDAGAQALAASPYLSQLRRITLYDNGISPAGEELLQARFGERVSCRN